ncbi:MAG: hypothetical protein ACTS7I_01885 [Candidatus Hodgkinia cicadicola]
MFNGGELARFQSAGRNVQRYLQPSQSCLHCWRSGPINGLKRNPNMFLRVQINSTNPQPNVTNHLTRQGGLPSFALNRTKIPSFASHFEARWSLGKSAPPRRSATFGEERSKPANINDGSPREAKKMSFVHLGVSTFNLMKYFV